tara:strand:- start:662 stop:1024 length:363 start_codon:yes stop_codon:yes gene_type:complete
MEIARSLASLEILWAYLHRKHSILHAIFLFIADHESCSYTAIADHFKITDATVVRAICSLGTDIYWNNSTDLVNTRIPDQDENESIITFKIIERENDDRSVHLTKKGRAVAKKIKEVSND